MINNAPDVNRSGDVATLSDAPEHVFRDLAKNQSAAMNAALMISGQYSRASKFQFRWECLHHLKAFLAPARNVSA